MIRNLLIVCVLLAATGCEATKSLLVKKPVRTTADTIVSANGPLSKPTPLSDQDKAEIHVAMANAAEERGDVEAALKGYQRARELGIESPETLHRMALLHDRRGESADSAQLYEAALAKEPNNCEVHCDYGYSLYLRQNWAESEAHLREAIRLKPDFNRAHNNLAMLLARTGQTDLAMAEFARAGVRQAEAHANIGLAMILEGNGPEATRHMTLAASLDPSNQMQERLATYRGALKGVETQLASSQVQVASHATQGQKETDLEEVVVQAH